MHSCLRSVFAWLPLRIAAWVLSAVFAVGQNPHQVEFLTFTTQGFVPSIINRHAGPFSLDVGNVTRIPTLQFVLVDQKNQPVISPARLGVSEQHRRAQFDLVLTPGTYTLRIQELPRYSAQIVIK